MKILARLLRAAAERIDPQPPIPSRFAPTWYWHGIIPPATTGRCERCGQWFYGSHACWTVDLTQPAPWWQQGTYTTTSTGTN